MYYCKSRKKWVATIRFNGNCFTAYYIDEKCAAYQIDLWIEQYDIPFVKKNNVEQPSNFIPYKPKRTTPELPQGIFFVNKKYRVKFTHNKQLYKLGEFNTLDEAVECKTQFFKKVEEEKEAEIISRPITRNSEGNCILQIKKKNEIIDVLVDEDIYYNLIHYTWRITNNNYVLGLVNKQDVRLSHYVINYDGKCKIDHINGNTLDNRKCNLRIVSSQQNMMNRSSSPNASSKYIGVSRHTKSNKWHSVIIFNGKSIFLGSFDNEEDAARARDIGTKKYFGEFGRLNFPEN